MSEVKDLPFQVKISGTIVAECETQQHADEHADFLRKERAQHGQFPEVTVEDVRGGS